MASEYNPKHDPKEKSTLKPIDIPVDFEELITLQPLITQINVYEILKKNLDDYRWNYFMSHCKTATEVLDIIPEKQHQKYFENTFHSQKSNRNPETLAEYFKQRYTKKTRYSEWVDDGNGNDILVPPRTTYYKEDSDIIIDTTKKKLIFVAFNLDHGHQYYGKDTIYHFNKDNNQLKIEFKWSFVPWYSNRSTPQFFSHYYTFDLNTNKLIYCNNLESKS